MDEMIQVLEEIGPPAPDPTPEDAAGDTYPTDVDWPAGLVDLQYELVELPSGVLVRVDRHVTYGDLLVVAVVTLLLVVQLGRLLFDRIRGVL